MRDYQRQLAERTQSARQSSAAVQRQLGFIAAGQGWLIDIGDASEIMAVPKIARVPHTRDWFLGLINHRGSLAGVVDFDVFLGQPRGERCVTDRLIVLSERFSLRCALRVSGVNGLMNGLMSFSDADAASVTTAAAATPTAQPTAWGRWAGPIYRHGGREWRRLDLPLLLSDPRFIDATRR